MEQPTVWNMLGVTYNGKTIYVLAVDHAAQGFNLAQGSQDELTTARLRLWTYRDDPVRSGRYSNCGL
ncbi:hypothetical protein BKA58DRAFT_445273 [Alternaria rosae]|uniref:uncharacterized protein n=1 Tax=Alternaria rosae TaxID=1187941 RepID=UPI001E8DED98|nr:uncharacterized protein BKA58DRAFT_445273 [Alternaria rosae]KAH6842158.1 hypothetical protein BKA58DRAFT_445273 [Alternaria rosae]